MVAELATTPSRGEIKIKILPIKFFTHVDHRTNKKEYTILF